MKPVLGCSHAGGRRRFNAAACRRLALLAACRRHLLAALLLALAFPPAQEIPAQEISVSGNCPLAGERTFALGDTLTFTHEESPPLSLAALPAAYSPCEEIRFTGTATGKPPLTLRWLLDGALFASGASATIPPGRLASGGHSMVFEASNAYGTVERATPFSVAPLAFLLAPTAENLGGSQARFRANTSGATEWQWIWGDGTTSPWLASCEGFAPTHLYPRPGTYTAQILARNCREAPIGSQLLSVTVTQTLAARVLRFAASNCPLGFCIFPVGTPVLFDQAFAGAPTVYRYDWDGNGTYEQSSGLPVLSHAYPAAGSFTPVLQVTDGVATSTFRHALPLLIEISPVPRPAVPDGLALDVLGYEISGPPAPQPPGDVWTLSHAIVRARWSDRSTDETGFNLFVSQDGGPFQLVATVPSGTTAIPNQRLATGSRYTLRVTAYNAGGESLPSGSVSLDLRN